MFYINICRYFDLLLQKTKPTQHSVRDLRGLGLTPNIIACRSTKVYLFILVLLLICSIIHN